jgi:hypothetical protein
MRKLQEIAKKISDKQKEHNEIEVRNSMASSRGPDIS